MKALENWIVITLNFLGFRVYTKKRVDALERRIHVLEKGVKQILNEQEGSASLMCRMEFLTSYNSEDALTDHVETLTASLKAMSSSLNGLGGSSVFPEDLRYLQGAFDANLSTEVKIRLVNMAHGSALTEFRAVTEKGTTQLYTTYP